MSDDPSAFAPDRSSPLTDDVPGVDGELLAALYDVVACFGRPYRTDQMRALTLGGDRPLCVRVVVDPPGNHNMMITRTPYGIAGGRARTILLSDELPSGVVWDADIDPNEVREFIRETDATFAKLGLVDAETGARTKITYDDPPPPLAVDEVFAGPGVMVVVPPDETPSTVRAMFDRPDDLHFVITSRGDAAFVHKNDRDAVRRADACARVMARWGITDHAEISTLPKDRFLRFLAEAEAELFGSDN